MFLPLLPSPPGFRVCNPNFCANLRPSLSLTFISCYLSKSSLCVGKNLLLLDEMFRILMGLRFPIFSLSKGHFGHVPTGRYSFHYSLLYGDTGINLFLLPPPISLVRFPPFFTYFTLFARLRVNAHFCRAFPTKMWIY